MKPNLRWAFVALSWLMGCEGVPPPFQRTCDEQVAVILLAAARTEAGDVRVDGAASTTGGIAIRTLTVAGVAATPQAFNYQRFSVTLSEAQVPARGEMGSCTEPVSSNQVCLRALVTTSCARTDELPWQVVTVRGAVPPILSVQAPRWVLPANQGAPLTVLLRSENDRAQATLRLTTPPGGSLAGEAWLDLSGSTRAEILLDRAATAVVYGAAEGFVVLDLTAERAEPARQIITVAGPPRIAPDAAEIPAGASLRFSVTSTARLERCQSVGPAQVQIGGVDAALGVLLDDVHAEGEVSLETGIVDPTTLRCWDEFGQRAEATFLPAS